MGRDVTRSTISLPDQRAPSVCAVDRRPDFCPLEDYRKLAKKIAHNGSLLHFTVFAEELKTKFSTTVTGEPEEQIRAPFETLIRSVGRELGLDVVPIGETLLENRGGKPDYGVASNKLLCGYVELKAPGKGADPTTFGGHDKKQWEKFRALPNILYSDGIAWSLFRYGKLISKCSFESDPRTSGPKGISPAFIHAAEELFREFFDWQPIVPGSARQLADFLAPLCRMLRDDVALALKNKAAGVTLAAKDWRRYLFPGATDGEFADAYAQTVVFTLLLARSNGSDTLFLDEAIGSLTSANTLLSRALKVLTDPLVQQHLGTTLGLLQRVINAVPTGTMSGGRTDPWLHFYEDFLQEYDPVLRKDAGAYYTPVSVVQAQVRLVDDILTRKFKKRLGFAQGGVSVLDPAVGTGTYLLGIIEHALARVEAEEGAGSIPARASLLAANLYGFEIMVGPYAVAALRLTRMLMDRSGEIHADGVQVMLNNTLESPNEKIPELPLLYQPIGLEHQRAKRIKESVNIVVCIGNPPYDRHAKAALTNRAMTGGWVRWGESLDGKGAILADFIEPVKRLGKGNQLKNLYNQYIYFWRWGLWKVFEHELATGPGIVSYITASSFLDGDAFLGVREWMRRLCDEIWIIDLGGEGRGTYRDENVFDIQTPVAVTIAVRYTNGNRNLPATVNYTRIEGSRTEKLEQLDKIASLDACEFSTCPNEWTAPFKPSRTGDFFSWPLLSDIMPWQQSGVKAGRTWVIGQTVETLRDRIRMLFSSIAEERANLFKESPTGRKLTDKPIDGVNGLRLQSIKDATPESNIPLIERYAYRAFDRQFIVADARFLDRNSPSLWETKGPRQVYFASLSTTPIQNGPAVIASASPPDLHMFRGSYGAKDVFPLYRDKRGAFANIHPDLLRSLSVSFGASISVEDIASYLYGILTAPSYTSTYSEELKEKAVRVPITLNADLFAEASRIGRELIYLHSYGDVDFDGGRSWPRSVTKCLKPVGSDNLPSAATYDADKSHVSVGNGLFGPVSSEVWEFEVSGFKVVQSWLNSRKDTRVGRSSSPLDDIRPTKWTSAFTEEFLDLLNVLAHTVSWREAQADLLERIVSGPLLLGSALGSVPGAMRKPPVSAKDQHDLHLE